MSAETVRGHTALQVAEQQGEVEVVELLEEAAAYRAAAYVSSDPPRLWPTDRA